MIATSRKTKISPPELARLWGIDQGKVLTWIRNGELRAINAATDRNGRPRYLIDVADIAIFEASRAVTPPAPRLRRRRCERRAKKPAPGRLKKLAPEVVCVL